MVSGRLYIALTEPCSDITTKLSKRSAQALSKAGWKLDCGQNRNQLRWFKEGKGTLTDLTVLFVSLYICPSILPR